ncbi:MAG: hypothetical protein IJV13_00340 [Prevotella sp.]|nr:hypothetical protein [Prevotella sp.]MBQ9650657.1 hypothetical protein [Prevotella sp.]
MADFEHNKANLGAATLSSAITSSQTSITVDASDASTFPSTPFYATISPIGETPNLLNAEIVKVTAISSGTLTVARGQRSTTAKAFAAGSVIFNGVYTQDLDYAQAVGRAFFTASYSAGVFYINNAMLPTTPTDGMSIRVIFSQDVTTGAVGVSLNNGTTYNVYAGAAITSDHGSATTNPQVKSGIIYELVFYNGAWYVMNLPANNSITSDNIDFTTLRKVLYDGGDTGTTGDVALSESAANYEYMVIYFRPNDGYLSSTKIRNPNGKRAFLISGYAGGGTSDTSGWNIKLKVVSISGTSITPFAYKEYNGSVANSNYIYITRIEGWNI